MRENSKNPRLSGKSWPIEKCVFMQKLVKYKIGVLKPIKKCMHENSKNPRLSGKSWIEKCGHKNRVFMQKRVKYKTGILKPIKKCMSNQILKILGYLENLGR